MPPPVRGDDRLDLASSGKSRSEPNARGRMRAGGARASRGGRGRRSMEVGRDYRELGLHPPTIDEDVRSLIRLRNSALCKRSRSDPCHPEAAMMFQACACCEFSTRPIPDSNQA